MDRDKLRKFLRNSGYALSRPLLRVVPTRPAILCFHAVGHQHPRHLTKDRFQDVLSWVADNYRVLPMRKLRPGNSNNEQPTVCLTFDDAYRSHFTVVRPLLNDYDVKGTFYIPTDFIGGNFSTSDGVHPTMPSEQLRILVQQGHELGSHGHTHRNFPRLSENECLTELRKSKNRLESITESNVNSLAYPEGKFDEKSLKATRKVGFSTAVTTEDRCLKSDIDWLKLPRITVSNQLSPEELKVKMTVFNRILRTFGSWI